MLESTETEVVHTHVHDVDQYQQFDDTNENYINGMDTVETSNQQT